MTPAGIRLGRQYDSRVTAQSVTSGGTVEILKGDANRVALVVAVSQILIADWDGLIIVGPVANNVVTPLTVLTPGHPVCYLSVDKIGSALFTALSVTNDCSGDVSLGITVVRQVQELP